MTDHTPEPWSCEQPWAGFSALRGPSKELIFGIACGGPEEKQPDAVCDANAARIVACVNACAGIPTEQLEKGDLGKVLREVGGSWRAFELELRQDLGNTNYQIIADALAPFRKD